LHNGKRGDFMIKEFIAGMIGGLVALLLMSLL